MKCELLNIESPIGEICPSRYNADEDVCYEQCGFINNPNDLHKCKTKTLVKLRKDCGFAESGIYTFCNINKNSIGALLPCCEKLCPLHKKVLS